VSVNLLGRYMLADRREFPCQVVNMSPGGMALIAPVTGQPGERVIAYVDHLGRLEGHIARLFQNGFALTISATARKRDKLAAQLTWLANRHILGLPEDRRHGRIVPRNPMGRLILPNGLNLTCRVIDMSQSGAGMCKAAWCATSRMVSRSNSRGCSTSISSKKTSPAVSARSTRGGPITSRCCRRVLDQDRSHVTQ
jgi:hypothetical protein